MKSLRYLPKKNMFCDGTRIEYMDGYSRCSFLE